MKTLYYVTMNSSLSGRASHGYTCLSIAVAKCEAMNAKAEALDTIARYTVEEATTADIPSKEIR